MTSGPRSQCDTCVRFRPDTFGVTHCAAFPDGIPKKILRNGLDHRQPVTGDHGLRWTSAEGEEFPEYAFLPAVSAPRLVGD